MNKYFLAVVSLLFTSILFAQFKTYTPYSLIGAGDFVQSPSGASAGMGGVAIGLQNGKLINFLNPASHLDADSNDFVLDFSVSQFTSELQDEKASVSNSIANFNHVLIKFPFYKWWSASFGVLPLSNVDYKIKSPKKIQGSEGTVNEIITGEGGINQLYFGQGWKINDDFSIGVNAIYLWGHLNYSKILDYSISGRATIWDLNQKQDLDVKSFRYSVGTQYKVDLNETDYLRFGLTYQSNASLGSDIETKSVLGEYREGSEVFREGKTNKTEKDNTQLRLPHQIGFGLSYQLGSQWLFAADYIHETSPNYEAFKLQTDYSSKATNAAKFGVEFVPSTYSKNYFALVNYRAGINYQQFPYQIKGQDLTQYTLSFGLGLPFPDSFRRVSLQRESKSMAHLSFEIGGRGQTTDGLVQERYYGFRLNVLLNNRWFFKRKYY